MGFLDEKYLITSETSFAIFSTIRDLPIVDAHNHADVAEIAANKKYSDPWQVFAATDHYVWEVMRKREIPERYITGDAQPKEKWLKLASIFPELVGNPVYEWVHLDLRRSLGIKEALLSSATAEDIWEEAKAVLAVNSKKPQGLLKEMNIEVMCSTDDPVDLLQHHDAVNKDMKKTVVRPTWRPDKAMNIHSAVWKEYIEKLGKRFNVKIDGVGKLIEALSASHDYFAKKGCISSDHGITYPLAGDASAADADAVFKKALEGHALTRAERDTYMSYIMKEVAELDAAKGWVFQMHIGAVRDIRDSLMKNLGHDSGGDVSDHMIDIVTPLGRFLNKFDNRLKVVLYCLDPGHQASLATVSRAFGANVRLGSAWWLNDTPVGMRRQLEYIGSVDLLYNFAGMVSDSRKILSYASRFEMFRRILSETIATMIKHGQMPYQLGEKLAERMCYSGTKSFYNL